MNKINARHTIFIILGTTIIAMKIYPNMVIEYCGRDCWIAVAIASLLISLFIFYILHICKKTNTYNICEVYDKAIGKQLSSMFLLLFAFTLFLTILESASVGASSLNENLLLESPPWYILLFFVLTGAYAMSKGFRPVIIITVVTIVLIMIAGIILGTLTIKYKELKYLLPILENGLNLDFWIGMLKSLGFYSCISILLPFLINLDKKENSKLKKSIWIALIIVIQMQLVSMTGVISTFGYKRALSIWYPKLIQTQLISYFGFLEFGEFFVMIQIVGGWFIKYLLTFCALSIILKQLKLLNKYTVYIISALIYVFCYLITKRSFFLLKYLVYYNYICLINFLIIPLIIFTIFFIRNKNKQ